MNQHPDKAPRVRTPCVRICTLDQQRVCIGCGRTIEEIGDWPFMDDEERLDIIATAQARLENLNPRKEA